MTASATHNHDDHSSPEYIRGQLSIFRTIFFILLAGTFLNVFLAQIPMSPFWHITLALFVTVIKASLVLLFFMHFISERTTTYLVMAITAVLFAGLFGLSLLARSNPINPAALSAKPVPMEQRIP